MPRKIIGWLMFLGLMIIYSAFNFQSGKVYIGQTTGSLNERIQGHKDAAKSKKGYSVIFRNAIRKHGIESFVFSVLRICDSQDELNRWECYYIALFGGYNDTSLTYNMKDGGISGATCKAIRENHSNLLKIKYKGVGNPFYGKIHTDESRAKISKNRKGKLVGPNHYMYGKSVSQERIDSFVHNLANWRKSEEGKIALSVKNSGFSNPYAVKFTEEQKKFIIDLRLNQNISIRKTVKLFSEKYFKISDSPVKTVCKYA